MLRHYLTTTLRHLRKQKRYAFINVFGLALGIAFCTLILLFVRDELGFDRFHAGADRIYRVHRVPAAPDGLYEASVSLPMPLGPAMQATFPEVDAYVRFDGVGPGIIRRGGELFEEVDVVFADAAVFDVFSFPLVSGDPATALADPDRVVLTETAARTYFGDRNPVGETLSIRLLGTFRDFQVSAVARDLPANSTIRFAVLLPYEALFQISDYLRDRRDRWDHSRTFTYVRLAEGADAARVEAAMPAFLDTHLGEMFASIRERGAWTGEGPPFSYHLQRLTDVHLDPDVPGGFAAPSNPVYAYILSGIALIVLLIACINFTTLAIGRSSGRAREIGLRKVVGAYRRQVMAQFWAEALLLSFIALALGLALVELFLPVFNELTQKALRFDLADGLALPAALFGIALATGLLAGAYPAVVLSRLRPVATLKNRLRLGGSNAFTRSLVTVQFALSVFLIVSTLVMLRQLDYLRTRPLGFDGEHVVVVPMFGFDGARVLDTFRNTLAAEPGVVQVAGANISFTRASSRRGFRHEEQVREVFNLRVTPGYFETLRLTLAGGRFLDAARPTDATEAVLVNEAFARMLGWTDPVGRQLPDLEWGDLRAPTVVGVVEDFQFASLAETVEPAIVSFNPSDGLNFLLARVRPDDVQGTVGRLRSTWAEVVPDVPFRFSFLDEDMDGLYRAEERWGRIIGYGAFFALLVAALGLFGLAALTVSGRTKEIGIRKVLGASVPGLALLLSKDFARLVLAAVALAVPAVYLAMQAWLGDFAHRIALSPAPFAAGGLLVLAVALATVGLQTMRAARADPVDSLRYE